MDGLEANQRGTRAPETDAFDVVVIGAGFAGLYLTYRLRDLGVRFRVYETGDDVGGTWYWNRYPGARCDVESVYYSYSFSPEVEQEWEWSERYPAQPEILRYLNHVADRFELRREMVFGTRVDQVCYDEAANRWTIETDRGDKVSATYVITAAGCLSAPQPPRFPGLDTFRGDWYHTGAWPHAPVSFEGKRVVFVGTGSTGIQAIPAIARTAAHLTVFQRTPNYSVPARNEPLHAETQAQVKAQYRELREQMRHSSAGVPIAPEKSVLEDSEEVRSRVLSERWRMGGMHFVAYYNDVVVSADANAIIAEFVRQQIRQTVNDPKVAELLCPYDYPIMTKRICMDSQYFETYNRADVELVSIRTNPIAEITPTGLRLEDGSEYAANIIVFAIGFDAMTGPLLRMDVRGRGGQTLAEKWAGGPRSYLGLQIAGFPNLFTVTGPGSPSVLSNMVVSIEQHVDWITDCIAYLRENAIDVIEADAQAEEAWVDHVREVAYTTLYPRANSWYMGANIPGKARVFMPYVGGVDVYREKCDAVAADNYEGFVLTSLDVREPSRADAA